jgi:hypothetical protein
LKTSQLAWTNVPLTNNHNHNHNKKYAGGELREALVPNPTGGAYGNGSDGLAKGASADFDAEAVLAAMKRVLKPVPRRDTDHRAELKQRANDAAEHQGDTQRERLQNELASDEMKESLNRVTATVEAKRGR